MFFLGSVGLGSVSTLPWARFGFACALFICVSFVLVSIA